MELKVREHCSRSVVSVNILVFFLADWHFVIAGYFSFWSNKICYRFSNISGSWWSSWTWFCIYRYNIGISHEGWFSLLYQCQSYLSLDLSMTGQTFFFLERAGELHVVVLIDRKGGLNYNAETMAWVSLLLHVHLIRAKQPHPKHCSIPTMAAAPPTLLPPPASTSLPAHVSPAARDGRPAGSHQTCTGCASSRWTKLWGLTGSSCLS